MAGTWKPMDDGRVALKAPLTAREEHIVELLAQGLTSQDIADRLGLSVRTIEAHVGAAAEKVPGDLPRQTRLICWWRGAGMEVLTGPT